MNFQFSTGLHSHPALHSYFSSSYMAVRNSLTSSYLESYQPEHQGLLPSLSSMLNIFNVDVDQLLNKSSNHSVMF